MASPAATFAKPGLNYLHGTPQSLDRTALAVTVLLQQADRNGETKKKSAKLNTGTEGRQAGWGTLFSADGISRGKRRESNNRVLCRLHVRRRKRNAKRSRSESTGTRNFIIHSHL